MELPEELVFIHSLSEGPRYLPKDVSVAHTGIPHRLLKVFEAATVAIYFVEVSDEASLHKLDRVQVTCRYLFQKL